TESCSEGLQYLLHRLKKSDVLWASSQIADELGYSEGLKFAEANAGPAQQPGLSLLRANLHLESDSSWLGFLNDYLEHLDLAPISLDGHPGSRFSQLCVTQMLPKVEGPLISVIMPAYNSEATLALAANSILRQTWRNLELIIVDDCSSDGTWSQIQELV